MVEWASLIVAIMTIVGGFIKLSRGFARFDKELALINYALFNEGKTGLVNKVDILIENQACIKTDIALLKVRSDK